MSPSCNCTVDGLHFTRGYYLTDRIYPEWSTLVKSFKNTNDPKAKKFKRFQESARKDIERAFGILQGRFSIIKNPARQFYISKIQIIMYTCVLLHNMITEDNGRAFCGLGEYYPPTRRPRHLDFHERVELHMRMDKELRDKGNHHFLRDNLIEHIWNLPLNHRIRYDPSSGPSNIPEHVTNQPLDEEEADEEDENDEVEEEYGDED
ncbi:uncharacterized protein [Rutidosis leptorrhynchoides]|uniref:uncharacterized protein n=1 Tax=Rutidosis leptorrhynchoides TaxID=125765 RepID=UPI003A99B1F8